MKLETVALGSISPDPANTRKHSRRNLDAIKASLRRFGQQKPIVVDAKGVVLAGNGTLAAATELGWSEIQIVRTALVGVDATAFGIADNRTAELAEWDDKLGDVLASLKAEDFPLEEIGFDEGDLAELLNEPVGADETYTQKIEAPIYEPKGERPLVSELYDDSKTRALVAEIRATELPSEIANFLEQAADRHTVFNFRKIAEFYAHADKPTQQLMEKSALVIIDFQKAIENGFVRMTEGIGKLVEKEESDAR